MDETRKIILEKYPEYLKAYDKVLKRDYGYMFNMMIMDKKCFEHYCKWLFDILFELKTKIDMPKLSAFQGRFYGRISEIMFNVWLEYQIVNGKLKKKEIKEFYKDGGILFVCLFSFVFGWLTQMLYRKFTKRLNVGSFILYSLVMYGVFVSFMRAQTCIPSYWISFIMTYYLFNYKYDKEDRI